MWKKRQREKFRFHLFNARCTTDSRAEFAIEASQNAQQNKMETIFSVLQMHYTQKIVLFSQSPL